MNLDVDGNGNRDVVIAGGDDIHVDDAVNVHVDVDDCVRAHVVSVA